MTDSAVRPMRKTAKPAAVTKAAVVPATAPENDRLHITVINGDLTFEPEPLLLGHYQALRLTGTEKVMNGLIGGAMERSLEMGVYPVAIGSNQIFINTRPNLERGILHAAPEGRHRRRPR